MSMGYRGKTTNLLRENVAVQAQAERESMYGEMTGTVVSFDATNQTISVQPDYKPLHNGEKVTMPQLDEVPIRFVRAGGFVITHPIKPGNRVVLRPQMRSTEEWHTGGDYTAEGDRRNHNLSDMEAFLDGGEPLTDPISAFNTANMEIRSQDGSFGIEFSEDGRYRIKGALGDILDLLTSVVENLAIDQLLITHGSSSGSGHQLSQRSTYAEISAKLRAMVIS